MTRTEEFVRREVGRLLRACRDDTFLCASCLLKLVRQSVPTRHAKPKIEQALDKVFESPGPLTRRPTFSCAECGKTMLCLGAPRPPDAQRRSLPMESKILIGTLTECHPDHLIVGGVRIEMGEGMRAGQFSLGTCLTVAYTLEDDRGITTSIRRSTE